MYAESGRMLREAMTDLLRTHRVQLELTGRPSGPPIPDVIGKRTALSAIIQRYRQAVLAWCAQTSKAIDPYIELNVAPGPKNPFARADRELNPLTELQESLSRTLEASTADLPDLDLLSTTQSVPFVETWRTAARPAALAEHDLSGVGDGVPLSVPQAQTVLADIGAVTQSLIVLDKRCKLIPGWEPLRGTERLGWAALAASLDAGLGTPDLTVDRLGWNPPVRLLRGAVQPGALGVLQAEYNLLLRLHTLPTANNLRQIVDSQRMLSREAAPYAKRVDPDLGAAWYRRAATYARLRTDLRDIGGVLGTGHHALEEAINAVHRLRTLPEDTTVTPRTLAALNGVFNRIDQRIADIVVDAIGDGSYLQRQHLDRFATRKQQRTQLAKAPFVRVEELDTVAAVRTVCEHLRPNATPRSRPLPDKSRAQLAAAIASPVGRRHAGIKAPEHGSIRALGL